MSRLSINLVFSRVDDFLARLDWIDGGPHPMDPLRLSSAARQFLASIVIRDLASIPPDEAHARHLHATAKSLAETAIGGLLAGWEQHDAWFGNYWDDWHPPIPHWGGTVLKPQPDPWKGGATHWLNELPAPVLQGLIDGAVTSVQQRVRAERLS